MNAEKKRSKKRRARLLPVRGYHTTSLTRLFTIIEPQNPSIDTFYVAQKTRPMDLKALKHRHVWSCACLSRTNWLHLNRQQQHGEGIYRVKKYDKKRYVQFFCVSPFPHIFQKKYYTVQVHTHTNVEVAIQRR